MGLYRDEHGIAVELDDNYARTRGYAPVSPAEESGLAADQAAKLRQGESGALGGLNSLLTGAASTLTLGASDVALGALETPADRERTLNDINAHPNLRTAGEIGGAVLGGFASPGSALSRTPGGYLSSVLARQAETGIERGGILGAAQQLGAMGLEGAAQNAGQYIGHAALEDKDATVEGLAGALGTGFVFGAAGGGAALGVSKGAIAAHRLFSRTMHGAEGASDAATAWTRASQEALDADAATASVAKQRLDDIRAAKQTALVEKQQAAIGLKQEQITNPTLPQPEAVPPAPTGMPTSVFERPPQVAADAFPEIPPARGGTQTSVFERPPEVTPGGTQVVKGRAVPAAEAAPTTRVVPREEPTLPMREGPATKVIPKGGAPAADLETQLAEMNQRAKAGQSLEEMRLSHTTELLGKGVANDEAKLSEALAEFEAARHEFLDRVVNSAAEKAAGGMPWRGPGEGPNVPLEFAPSPKGTADVQTRVGKTPSQPPANANTPLAHEPTAPHTKLIAQLDRAHEEALSRAATATDHGEATAALKEADDLEQKLANLTPPDNLVQDIGRHAEVITRYEKASAALTEAVGDAAHPSSLAAAEGFSKAENEANRRVADRTARAVDDAQMGPQYATPKERMQYATSRKAEADLGYAKAKLNETEAKQTYTDAQKKVSVGEAAKKAAMPEVAAKGSKLANVGSVLEIADIPGLPKPSDLPVVGPLLGAWLKFRALKAAASKFMGKIPATADTKVAALAARTQERVAKAVDRSLGLVESASKAAAPRIAASAGVISRRIYDDGLPDAPKGAGIQELAATRIRELNCYVNKPGAIEADVRQQLSRVTDPDIIAAAEQHRRAAMEWLLSKSPKVPLQGPLDKMVWLPSGSESMSFSRRLEALNDPSGVFEAIAERRAAISLEAAETIQKLFPRTMDLAQTRVLQKSSEIQASVPYAQRLNLSAFYGLPLDASLQPDTMKVTQNVYQKAAPPPVPGAPPGMQAPPPNPSTAGPTNLTALFQTPQDRSAAKR